MSFSRIGRSLLKYLKPIRSAPPHLQNDSQKRGSPGFKPFVVKNEKIPTKDKGLAASAQQHLPAEKDFLPPEKTPNSWLELVSLLISACKRTTQKMQEKFGAAAYRKMVQSKGRKTLKVSGNIIDATPLAKIDDDDSSKAA